MFREELRIRLQIDDDGYSDADSNEQQQEVNWRGWGGGAPCMRWCSFHWLHSTHSRRGSTWWSSVSDDREDDDSRWIQALVSLLMIHVAQHQKKKRWSSRLPSFWVSQSPAPFEILTFFCTTSLSIHSILLSGVRIWAFLTLEEDTRR